MATDLAALMQNTLTKERQRDPLSIPEPLVTAAPEVVRARRIAYFVSRFPTTTETFILRELNAVASDEHVEADLYALFPTPPGVVQPDARPWLGRVHRPRLLPCLWNLARWAVRRPVRLASSVALVCADHWRRPLTLARALATVPVAAVHATSVGELGTDHVHAHFATYPALAAWFCGRLCDVPYSFTAHAHDLYMHELGLRRRVSDAAFVVSISEFNKRRLRELVPGDVPIHVVHCGVELGRYSFRARGPEPGGTREGTLRGVARGRRRATPCSSRRSPRACPASTASRSTWSATGGCVRSSRPRRQS